MAKKVVKEHDNGIMGTEIVVLKDWNWDVIAIIVIIRCLLFLLHQIRIRASEWSGKSLVFVNINGVVVTWWKSTRCRKQGRQVICQWDHRCWFVGLRERSKGSVVRWTRSNTVESNPSRLHLIGVRSSIRVCSGSVCTSFIPVWSWYFHRAMEIFQLWQYGAGAPRLSKFMTRWIIL